MELSQQLGRGGVAPVCDVPLPALFPTAFPDWGWDPLMEWENLLRYWYIPWGVPAVA